MQTLHELLTDTTQSLGCIVPELILFGSIVVVLTAGLFTRSNNLLFNVITILAAVASLGYMMAGGLETDQVLFGNMLRRDGFAEFLMILVDVSVLLTCMMSLRAGEGKHLSEFYALIQSVALGSHLLLMSSNLIMVFLSLELISISSYVLAGYAFNKTGSEGSLKYFLFGSIASAIMLYGFTLLYGFTGTMDYTSHHFFEHLSGEVSPLLLIAGLMGLSGFLFKIAAVPMHPWAPDVYEAAPVPVIAYLSVAPKVAGIGILTKFVLTLHFFGQSAFDWQAILAAIAMLTITVGNFSALWQKNPKRMMAYSSIAHSGFLLVGVAAFLPQGVQFMLFYATIYLFMNFCVFSYLVYFERNGIFSMAAFSGKGKKHIAAATGLTLGLVALTGLPPTAGFTAKVLIFSGLWESYLETHKSLLLWLLIFGLLNTVISLFYYLRMPYFAFMKTADSPESQKIHAFENYLGLALVVVVVVIFFIPALLMGLINRINFVH